MAYESPHTSSVKIEGISQLIKQLDEIAARGLTDALNDWLVKMGMQISADAIRKLTRGGKGRYTGRLANSYGHLPATMAGGVETIKSKSAIRLQVGTNVNYGKFVEGWPRAPRRHFLPYKGHPDFAAWSRRVRRTPLSEIRKGGGLMVGGKKSVRPHLLPALIANIPRMNAELNRALEAK